MIGVSIVLIILGAYLVSYTTIEMKTVGYVSIPTITNPYHFLGIALLVAGGVLLAISLVLLVGIVLIREAKAPPPSTRRRR